VPPPAATATPANSAAPSHGDAAVSGAAPAYTGSIPDGADDPVARAIAGGVVSYGDE
jgi:hypothetical protein